MKISDTGYGIIEHNGKILMLKRNLPDKWVWEFPGGNRGEGESELECILREVEEETGLTCKPREPVDIIKGETYKKIFAIHLKCEPVQIILSNEHEGYIWVDKEEFQALSNKAVSVEALGVFR